MAWKPAHRKAMERYLGRELEPGEVVHHCNGDQSDNRIENLELTNAAEHVRIHREGKPFPKAQGERRPNAKLTERKVRQIKRLLAQGVYGSRIAPMFGVNVSLVYQIKYGERWAHVKGGEDGIQNETA
jgi:hypothetical protein